MCGATDARGYEKRLAGGLLKSVSRSFYLTLRMLPGSLRGTVSLAYLLARASDTVADAATLPAATRLALLGELDRSIQEGDGGVDLGALQEEVMPALDHEGEKELMRRFPECLEWLGALDEPSKPPVRGVLAEIIRGQKLDVERFPDSEKVRALEDAGELEDYAYYVAGSVGRFWTDLCFDVLGRKHFGEEPGTMAEWGKAYGKGLQLINILRDLPEDLGAGRCYLPRDQIVAAGGEGDRPGEDKDALIRVAGDWERITAEYLECGLRYVENINHRRLRYGTALPLLFGVRTLALLRDAGWGERAEGIKISRGEVKQVMAKTAVAVATKHALGDYWRELGGFDKKSVN